MTTKELLALVGRWREDLAAWTGPRSEYDAELAAAYAKNACADELEAALAGQEGMVMVPREAVNMLIRELESPVGCYTGAIAKELRYLLPAAPAQPDGVEALRKDAERYRWLRDEGWDAKFTAPAVHLVLEDGQIEKELDGPELDAAIDAARSRNEHEG